MLILIQPQNRWKIYKEGRPTPLTTEEILLSIKKAMEEEGDPGEENG